MGTLNSFKAKETKRILQKYYGCSFQKHGKGSHETRYSAYKEQSFTLAFHSATEIASGTLMSVLRDLDIDIDEFIKYAGKQR